MVDIGRTSVTVVSGRGNNHDTGINKPACRSAHRVVTISLDRRGAKTKVYNLDVL